MMRPTRHGENTGFTALAGGCLCLAGLFLGFAGEGVWMVLLGVPGVLIGATSLRQKKVACPSCGESVSFLAAGTGLDLSRNVAFQCTACEQSVIQVDAFSVRLATEAEVAYASGFGRALAPLVYGVLLFGLAGLCWDQFREVEAHELVRIDQKLALLWAILGSTNTVIALALAGVACVLTGLLRYARLRASADW